MIDSATLALQAMAQLLIMDANLHIDIELIAKRPYSLYYWKIKAVTALIAGIILGIINLLLLLIFGLPLVLFYRSLIILPLACLFGIIFGFTGWSLSWQMKNPYYFTNLFIAVITIVAGVLVIVTSYPKWLMLFSYIFPFYELVDFIKIGQSNLYLATIVALCWLLVGIICYIGQIKAVLNKKIHQY